MILGTMISLGSAHEIDLSGIGFGTGEGARWRGFTVSYARVCVCVLWVVSYMNVACITCKCTAS
jgi:hypothetical protein